MRTSHDFSLQFPNAYGDLLASADYRTELDDFQVVEDLGFVPSGEGEHVFLWLEKRGENTAWIAKKIAELVGVKEMDVGYAGRKDRHALTYQWFSVYLPVRPGYVEPDWLALNAPGVQLLKVVRHNRKLRRGEHKANNFVIRLRNVQCDSRVLLQERIEQVLAGGVPNYFGVQRFGNQGGNLLEAEAILVGEKYYRDKQKRSLMLSAARSYLFNLLLAARVRRGDWQQCVAGEPEALPTGPLWGRGRLLSAGDLQAWEQEQLSDWGDWCNALEHVGLQQERRPLVLVADKPRVTWLADDDVEIAFTLPTGAFATAVLQAIFVLNNVQGATQIDSGE